MRGFIKSILGNIFAGLVLLGGPIAVGILAYLQTIPWYLIALAVMFAPGVVIFSFTQSRQFFREWTHKIERSEKIIRDWLNKTRIDVKNDPAPERAFYRYTVSDEGKALSIFRSKDAPEFLTLGINLNIAKNDQDTIDRLTKDTSLIEDIVIQLSALGIGHGAINHPLRTISLSKMLIFENLNRLQFYEQIQFIFGVQLIVAQLISKEARRKGLPFPSGTPSQPKPDKEDRQP